MSNNIDLPVVLIKRRNIQAIFDYCLDSKVEFTVREKPFTVEEFEVILQITDIKKAIAFGIFARENKIEIVGVNDQQQQVKTAKKATATAAKAPEPAEPAPIFKAEKTVEPAPKEEEEEELVEEKAEDKGFSLDFSAPTLSFT
jgi:ribosomal protein L12E/L44/L45/RPP1/RPP2